MFKYLGIEWLELILSRYSSLSWLSNRSSFNNPRVPVQLPCYAQLGSQHIAAATDTQQHNTLCWISLKVHVPNLQETWATESKDQTSYWHHVWILVMFVSRYFSRPTIAGMHINQILANGHNKFSNFIYGTLTVTLFWRYVLKCCSGHKFLHCALSER